MKDDQILDSWKEISEYLGRSRKTCLRWEKELGLPIHRYEDSPKARVFTYKSEIDLWREKTLRGNETAQKLFPSIFSRLASATRSKLLLIPSAIVVLVIVSLGIWQLITEGKADNSPVIKNSIAVISFENQTGDSAYDYLQNVIPNLIITDLEQSDSLYVLTWERMHDLIKQIGKEDVDTIDIDLGFEICRREGIQSIIRGTYSMAGDTFVSDIKVLDVETKKTRKSHRTKGIGEDSILNTQIDALSHAVLEEIGIFESGGEGSMTRVVDVTTRSMVAYNLYLRGREAHRKYFFREAIPYFDRATELDPEFAMAYFCLARSYANQNDSEARDEIILKAKEYSSKATEKERLTIDAEYALFIEKNEEKWLSLKLRMAKKYPREVQAFKDLGDYYRRKTDEANAIEMYNKLLELNPYSGETHNALGLLYLNIENCNYEKAHDHFKMYVKINPHEPNPLDSLAHGNFYLGRVDEALLNFKAALEIKPNFDLSMRGISFIYAFKEDYEEAMDSIAKYMAAHSNRKGKYEGYMWKGFFCSWLGRYDEGLDYLTQSQQFAESEGDTTIKCGIEFIKAQIYRERGRADLSRKLNDNWYSVFIKEFPNSEFFYKSRYLWLLAMLDLQEGNLDSAKLRLAEGRSIISEIPKPRYKEWAIYFYNLLEGEILMTEGFYSKAISLFENEKSVVSPSVQSVHLTITHNFPFTRDILARAYIQNGELDKAIQEYESLTSLDRLSVHQRLIHPLYYYRAALLYEQKGWVGKAIEKYERFLNLWKDADPGMVEVEDARERLFGLE
jgi:tetratricopeptide (TPR) repeat protein